MTWQPIESAPRDRRILVWTGQAIHAAQWAKNPYTDEIAWVVGKILDDENQLDGDQLILREPTHWQELPEPPDE